MKRQVIARAIESVERSHRKATGKKLSGAAVDALRSGLESDPAQQRIAEELLARATGFGRTQGLLDSGSVLLWGVAGSLAAALLWEHRSWAPEAFFVAAFGAFGLQFRARFMQLSWWARILLVGAALSICALVSARVHVAAFVAARLSGS